MKNIAGLFFYHILAIYECEQSGFLLKWILQGDQAI